MPTDASTLAITDQRMLMVQDYCIAQQLGGITTSLAWCEAIGMHRANIGNIRRGHQSFTVSHIAAVGRLFDININWIYGFELNMLRDANDASVMDALHAAVAAVDAVVGKLGKAPKPAPAKASKSGTTKANPLTTELTKSRGKTQKPTSSPNATYS